MCFYGVLDWPLGTFLEEFCFNYDAPCPNKNCNTPLQDHVRRFCLANTCVTLDVQEVDSNISSGNDIQVWRFCTKCQVGIFIFGFNLDVLT